MPSLYLGDVVSTLKAVKPMADIVVTSPPYNLGKDYKVAKDKLPWDAYLDWTREWSRMLYAYGTTDECHFFLNVGGSPSQPLIPYQVLQVMLDTGWILQNEIIWVKSITMNETTRGHVKPINSPRFINQTHESIWHLTKTGTQPVDRLAVGVPYADKSNLKRFKGAANDLRCQGNTWFIPYPTSQERRAHKLHPCPFPGELPRRCILLAGPLAGSKVLDPFCGTGETLLAAQGLGLEGIGIDLCEEFLDVTSDRLGMTWIK